MLNFSLVFFFFSELRHHTPAPLSCILLMGLPFILHTTWENGNSGKSSFESALFCGISVFFRFFLLKLTSSIYEKHKKTKQNIKVFHFGRFFTLLNKRQNYNQLINLAIYLLHFEINVYRIKVYWSCKYATPLDHRSSVKTISPHSYFSDLAEGSLREYPPPVYFCLVKNLAKQNKHNIHLFKIGYFC